MMPDYIMVRSRSNNSASRRKIPYCGCFNLLTLAVTVLFFMSPFPAAGETKAREKFPFVPGEKLIYQGRWGAIPAGEIILEVLAKVNVNGKEAYHFTMITKTNAVVDLIYKVRERQDSYVDADMTRSLLYKKRTESKHARDVVITFDWDKMLATRSNFGKKDAPVHVLPGSFDPLALFYALRLQDIKENSVLEIPVTDGNRNIATKARVAKGGKIMIGDKSYETLEVIPDMARLEEAAKQKDEPQLKIWFTADGNKIPVKIQMQKGVISFVFELVSMPG